ncbi:MAG: bifunctional metallophosphatase/5'-nucleotidase [Lachnospiraceae bacterium]|nr:bifunctional metallophosphatase/5'-nucleotidase [Lachnospiraceae bacterium]
MKNIFKKAGAAILAIALLVAMLPQNSAKAANPTDEIVILYTNDIHTYVDNPENNKGKLSYDHVAAMKKDLKDAGKAVLLVDAGDHVQGTAYGSLDKGAAIVSFMEQAGYDLATIGNHEFDYEMPRALEIITKGKVPYVSCNFKKASGETVVDAYKIFELNGAKIAFVGVTTPESITKSTPKYFMDENGNWAYVIDGGEDGAALYATVQKAVDAAKAAGADMVIALGHLGIDAESAPWRSTDVIANVTGLSAFIDGHSHSTVECQIVKDKAGKDVVLTQTGSYLATVGKMTIGKDLSVKTELVSEYANSDAAVRASVDELIDVVEGKLGTVIGYAEEGLFAYNPADGKRLVRSEETNLGDFCADAVYYLFNDTEGLDVDVAIMNGGGIRADLPAGPITYKTCKTIHTFGNVMCLMTVKGQQILDMLEWAYKNVGESESGGFLHTAGLKYEIHTDIAANVVKDDKGIWASAGTGAYRVQNVQVLNSKTGEYEKLDLTKNYNIAGTNYTLRNMGDGFSMFEGATLVKDYVMEDYLALANYVLSFNKTWTDNGKVATITKAQYANLKGDGRITVVETSANTPDETPKTADAKVAGLLLVTFIAAAFASVATRKKTF